MAAGGQVDAIVVGAGPNGLAAAITLAQAGWSVLVREGASTVGGGARTEELTLPGFHHDVCSAIHPLAVASPLFKRLPLADFGLQWIEPPSPVAHVLDGHAVVAERDVNATGIELGRDAHAYAGLVGRIARDWRHLVDALLGPPSVPRHPFELARFGMAALRPAASLARTRFDGDAARALFAGHAAHSMLPLERATSAAFGLVLGASAHALGWPMPRGGSQRLSNALAGYLESLGGTIVVDAPVLTLAELPRAKAVLLDVTPRQLLRMAHDRLPSAYRRSLARYRYGVGVFKVDWALAEPIPWRDARVARAGTVHVGGTLEEVARSERAPWDGDHAERPFVLIAQPTLFDPTRAPAGKHIAWGYCHVPNGSSVDMTGAIERQVERFAPGFRDCILARSKLSTRDLERRNPNLVGGDINGGVQDLWQLVTRPTRTMYRTPADGVYLCSSSTPPGGGVHGMCGYHAARAVLADHGGRTVRSWT